MQIKGKVVRVLPTETVGANGFTKRRVHLEPEGGNPDYPQVIEIELQKDRCYLADQLAPGTAIEAEIDLRGREWTSPQNEIKVFNTIYCWKLTVSGPAVAVSTPVVPVVNHPQVDANGDVPF